MPNTRDEHRRKIKMWYARQLREDLKLPEVKQEIKELRLHFAKKTGAAWPLCFTHIVDTLRSAGAALSSIGGILDKAECRVVYLPVKDRLMVVKKKGQKNK